MCCFRSVLSPELLIATLYGLLLAAKKLKHLSTTCQGVYSTPCLLGVFAKLHSAHWNPDRASDADNERVMAISRLRESLWQLAQVAGKPDHKLNAADVQLLTDENEEHSEIAGKLLPLAAWLAQTNLAQLVAQSWDEQEERGPNEHRVFRPVFVTMEQNFDLPRYTFTSAYENPRSLSRC